MNEPNWKLNRNNFHATRSSVPFVRIQIEATGNLKPIFHPNQQHVLAIQWLLWSLEIERDKNRPATRIEKFETQMFRSIQYT